MQELHGLNHSAIRFATSAPFNTHHCTLDTSVNRPFLHTLRKIHWLKTDHVYRHLIGLQKTWQFYIHFNSAIKDSFIAVLSDSCSCCLSAVSPCSLCMLHLFLVSPGTIVCWTSACCLDARLHVIYVVLVVDCTYVPVGLYIDDYWCFLFFLTSP